MTNRTAPTHTALITFNPASRTDTVLIIDLHTGHVVDGMVVGDAEWIANGAEHLGRRGLAPSDTAQQAGGRGVSTWPLVRA